MCGVMPTCVFACLFEIFIYSFDRMPTRFWLSKEICTAPGGVLLTWTERWWVSISKFPPRFQHSLYLTLKTLWNAKFPDFPLVRSGSVSQSTPQLLACTFVYPQLLIQKEIGKHSQKLHPEQLCSCEVRRSLALCASLWVPNPWGCTKG